MIAEIQSNAYADLLTVHKAAPQGASGADFMAFLNAAQSAVPEVQEQPYQYPAEPVTPVLREDYSREMRVEGAVHEVDPAPEEVSEEVPVEAAALIQAVAEESGVHEEAAEEAGSAVQAEAIVKALEASGPEESKAEKSLGEQIKTVLELITSLLEKLQAVGEKSGANASGSAVREGLAKTLEVLKSKLSALLEDAASSPEGQGVDKAGMHKLLQLLEGLSGEEGTKGKAQFGSLLKQLQTGLEEAKLAVSEAVSAQSRPAESHKSSTGTQTPDTDLRTAQASQRQQKGAQQQSGEKQESNKEMHFFRDAAQVQVKDTPKTATDFAARVESHNEAKMLAAEAKFTQATGIRQPRQIFDQVVNRALITHKSGMSEMTLQLKPRFLGRIQMDLAVKDGALSARIIVSNKSLREFLESNLDILGQELRDAGINVSGMEVGQEADHSAFSDFSPEKNQDRGVAHSAGAAVPEGAAAQVYAQPQHSGSVDLVA